MALAGTYDARRTRDAIDDRHDISLAGVTEPVVTVTTPGTANQQFRVTHGLTTQPVYWLVIWQDAAGSVYASGDRATDRTHAYLKSSAAGMKVKLLFFSL